MGKGVPKHLRHLAAKAESSPTSGTVSGSTFEEQASPEPEPTTDPPKAASPNPTPTFPTIIVPDEETLLEAMGY